MSKTLYGSGAWATSQAVANTLRRSQALVNAKKYGTLALGYG